MDGNLLNKTGEGVVKFGYSLKFGLRNPRGESALPRRGANRNLLVQSEAGIGAWPETGSSFKLD